MEILNDNEINDFLVRYTAKEELDKYLMARELLK